MIDQEYFADMLDKKIFNFIITKTEQFVDDNKVIAAAAFLMPVVNINYKNDVIKFNLTHTTLLRLLIKLLQIKLPTKVFLTRLIKLLFNLLNSTESIVKHVYDQISTSLKVFVKQHMRAIIQMPESSADFIECWVSLMDKIEVSDYYDLACEVKKEVSDMIVEIASRIKENEKEKYGFLFEVIKKEKNDFTEMKPITEELEKKGFFDNLHIAEAAEGDEEILDCMAAVDEF